MSDENADHHRQWEASLMNSEFFNNTMPNMQFETIRLTQNIRVDANQAPFKAWLRKFGAGLDNTYPEKNFKSRVEIPHDIRANNLDDLINHVFPPEVFKDLESNLPLINKSAILTTTNKEAERINEKILDKIPSEQKVSIYNL
jgi:hypothetical protein